MKIMKSLLLVFCLFLNSVIPVFAKEDFIQNDYIKIEKSSNVLHSRLADTYDGYEYTIKNIYKEPVLIQSINIWDNAKANVAFLSVKKSGSEVAKNTLDKGVSLCLPTLTLSVFGSVVALPFVVAGNHFANKNAQREAARFDIVPAFPVKLKPGAKIYIKTLAIHKYYPLLRLVFVNPITDENMTMEFGK